MKIGVIGATGMLGQHTARTAVSSGFELVVIHRPGSDLSRIADLDFAAHAADISDAKSLTHAISGVDAVVHCAAYYPTLPRPLSEELDIARQQMGAFINAVRDARVQRAVYLGAAIALPRRPDGSPADGSEHYDSEPESSNPYVRCKWLMDRMVLDAARSGLPMCIAIPSMTFGEYDYGPSTGQLITRMASGELDKLVDGLRNVIYAGDAGSGIVRVAEAGQAGKRYLLTGHNTDMRDLARRIANLTGKPQPKPVPLPVIKLSSSIQGMRYRLIGGKPPKISATAIAVMSAGQHLDGHVAKSELGFEARTSLDEALRRAYDWFVSQSMI